MQHEHIQQRFVFTTQHNTHYHLLISLSIGTADRLSGKQTDR